MKQNCVTTTMDLPRPTRAGGSSRQGSRHSRSCTCGYEAADGTVTRYEPTRRCGTGRTRSVATRPPRGARASAGAADHCVAARRIGLGARAHGVDVGGAAVGAARYSLIGEASDPAGSGAPRQSADSARQCRALCYLRLALCPVRVRVVCGRAIPCAMSHFDPLDLRGQERKESESRAARASFRSATGTTSSG